MRDVIDEPFPNYVDKYYSYVSIIDPRYGYKVTNKDGLFKKVIKALETLNTYDVSRVSRRD